ncbi:MAG: helix-turn-helix domain-containing protein [Gammaproteobacteria bacterium]|nr:helix-turn-helix domain-containing protein [Gammaproteobacteria bacterium]
MLAEWASQWVEWALGQNDVPPLAQWLEEDLIDAAMERHDTVLNRAAQALGIPESTLAAQGRPNARGATGAGTSRQSARRSRR